MWICCAQSSSLHWILPPISMMSLPQSYPPSRGGYLASYPVIAYLTPSTPNKCIDFSLKRHRMRCLVFILSALFRGKESGIQWPLDNISWDKVVDEIKWGRDSERWDATNDVTSAGQGWKRLNYFLVSLRMNNFKYFASSTVYLLQYRRGNV